MAQIDKKKFIIDCDTGVDDAVALCMALDSPDIDLLAITVVDGNCGLEKAVANTLKTLKLAQKTVPVFAGCSKGLSTNGLKSDVIHGHDGLGGFAHEYEACEESLKPGHASQALVDLVNKYPGEITLVALGPLTNLAVAYRLDDTFSSKLKKLVIMGGNTEGKGNARLGAEFNFACDPVAAQIVLEDTTCHCQICGWELCGLKYAFSWEWFEKWTSSFTTARGEFMSKIVKPFSKTRKSRWPDSGFSICDPLAMSVALHPDIVTESSWQKVTVETSSPHCSGMMIPEWREGLFPRDTKKHELILSIDGEGHTENMDRLMLK